jgi:hypothetical protein
MNIYKYIISKYIDVDDKKFLHVLYIYIHYI